MKIIHWDLFIKNRSMTDEEIAEIATINSMKPLHEAFIKEIFFRHPDLHGKVTIGIGYPQVVEESPPKVEK